MFNKYSLGATVLAIFLMAIFGISRAFNWLRDSPSATDRSAPEEIESADRTGNGADDGFIESDRPANGQDRPLTSQANNGAASPANGQSGDPLSEDVFALTPLETAGTYIQRQQGAELDQLIADSDIDATPLSPDAIPIQNNNQPNAQPDPGNNTASGADSGSPPPASQSVPALW